MRTTGLIACGMLVALLTGACERKDAAPETGAVDAESIAPPTMDPAARDPIAAADPASQPAEPAAQPATESAATDTVTPPPAAPGSGTPAGPTQALASQETNWPGITADVTEFRRKGNTLTARVRFRNVGGETAQPDVNYDEAYLMDAAGAKKYEVLKDEKDRYIAALRTGYSNRWYGNVAPGASQLVWMKFPAPPPTVSTVTLQIPEVPPFEDLAIQDR